MTVAVIAAAGSAAAGFLGYLANRRSLKRSVGTTPGVPLTKLLERMEARFESRLERIETKLDLLHDQHADARERLARLEAERLWQQERRR
jgi:hypothetical protein